jgi:hypothetical protein
MHFLVQIICMIAATAIAATEHSRRIAVPLFSLETLTHRGEQRPFPVFPGAKAASFSSSVFQVNITEIRHEVVLNVKLYTPFSSERCRQRKRRWSF